VADWLERERKKDRRCNPQQHHINFVKPGEAAKPHPTKKTSILDGTTGWNLEVDLGKKLVFPGIVQTRHYTVVRNRKKAHHDRANSTLGNTM